MSRQNDPKACQHARSNRLFRQQKDWFFKTREGALVGPYDSSEQALQGIESYIQFVQKAPTSVVKVLFNRRPLAAA